MSLNNQQQNQLCINSRCQQERSWPLWHYVSISLCSTQTKNKLPRPIATQCYWRLSCPLSALYWFLSCLPSCTGSDVTRADTICHRNRGRQVVKAFYFHFSISDKRFDDLCRPLDLASQSRALLQWILAAVSIKTTPDSQSDCPVHSSQTFELIRI